MSNLLAAAIAFIVVLILGGGSVIPEPGWRLPGQTVGGLRIIVTGLWIRFYRYLCPARAPVLHIQTGSRRLVSRAYPGQGGGDEGMGKVPINQMGIVLKDGLKKSDAEAVAKTLDGSVVGGSLHQPVPVGAFHFYEADLDAAIKKAKGTNGVEVAFPNQAVELWADIKGTRSALNDPVYSGEKGPTR